MKDFFEEYGAPISACWIICLWLFRWLGMIPLFVLLNIIGATIVLSLIDYSYIYSYIKSLFYVMQNRIQIKPCVSVYLMPKSFSLINEQTGQKTKRCVLEEESIKKLNDIAFEIGKMKNVCVEVYCNVYFLDKDAPAAENNDTLAAENKKIVVRTPLFSRYLHIYHLKNRNVDYDAFTFPHWGTVVSIQKSRFDQPISIFFNHFINSKWKLAKEYIFRQIVENLSDTTLYDTKELDTLSLYKEYDDCDWCTILKNKAICENCTKEADVALKKIRKEETITKSHDQTIESYISFQNDIKSENKDLLKKVQEIDRKAEDISYPEISRNRWKHTIRQEIVKIINSTKLSSENHDLVLEILTMILNDIEVSKKKTEDINTAATLSALQDFLLMNGYSATHNICSKDERKEDG